MGVHSRIAAADSVPSPHRCRLCTANDREALIEDLAEHLWEEVRHGSPDDWPWPKAGYRQGVYRGLARRAVEGLSR